MATSKAVRKCMRILQTHEMHAEQDAQPRLTVTWERPRKSMYRIFQMFWGPLPFLLFAGVVSVEA